MSRGTTQQRSRARALPLDRSAAARLPERVSRFRRAPRDLLPAVLCLLVVLAGLLSGAGPASANKAGFAGAEGRAVGFLVVDLIATPQWRDTLERQASSNSRACAAVRRKICALAGWGTFLEGLSGASLRAKIKAVNFFVNQVRYREDSEAWGSQDYWATPREFFGQGGDCEDYAIAKYLALRALGIAADQLFVMVAKDLIQGTMHAVLVVDTPDGPLVLDNRSDLIVSWRDFDNYRPIFWVNEEAGWMALARK